VSDQKPMAWLPFSIAEAAFSDDSDAGPAPAWSQLLDRLRESAQVVESDPANRNRTDLAAGMRHLLVLLAAGIDEVLRFDPDPILSVAATSTDDAVTWGMECPDCIYTRAVLRGGESYRLFGNRGTARYVGLQTMNGIAATAMNSSTNSRSTPTATSRWCCRPIRIPAIGCASRATIPR
jgi:hypothetical protein